MTATGTESFGPISPWEFEASPLRNPKTEESVSLIVIIAIVVVVLGIILVGFGLMIGSRG